VDDSRTADLPRGKPAGLSRALAVEQGVVDVVRRVGRGIAVNPRGVVEPSARDDLPLGGASNGNQCGQRTRGNEFGGHERLRVWGGKRGPLCEVEGVISL